MSSYLSLFNGISAGRLALDRAGISFDKYYIAEIDKFANKVSEYHYPDNIQLGDVTRWREWDIDWVSVELVTAGFPCQSWSLAGKQLGDKDERGKLFWVTLDIMSHVLKNNPRAKFMLENVKMKKEFEDYITLHTENALGKVYKTLINSALVSAQNRNRFYWTNFPVSQPKDKGLLLKDIIMEGLEFISLNEKEYSERSKRQINKNSKTLEEKAVSCCCNSNMTGSGVNVIKIAGGATRGRYVIDGVRQDHKMRTAGMTTQRLEDRNDGKTNTLTTIQKDNVVVRATVQKNAEHTFNGKVPTLTASAGVGGGNVPLYAPDHVANKFKGKYIDANERLQYRKLTPTECARLQTFPDGWCESIVSNTQSYKAYGNAWTVDVIAHIFKCMEKC